MEISFSAAIYFIYGTTIDRLLCYDILVARDFTKLWFFSRYVWQVVSYIQFVYQLSNQQVLILAVAGFYAVGFIGLFIGGSVPLLICWLPGIGSGGAISMSKSIGYVLGAAGPLFIGLLFDITNDWTYPLITIIVVCMIMTIVGLGAGRDKYVVE